MSKDHGGPAFPTHTNPRPGQLADAPQGMNLRDYFAAKAMHGFAASIAMAPMEDFERIKSYAAKAAYAIADAMIEARGGS